MWKIWFKINGEIAVLEKEYKGKPNASKYAKKVFGGTIFEYAVAQENPFVG